MQQIIIQGRQVKEPFYKMLDTNEVVTNSLLEVKFKNELDYIPIVMWGSTALDFVKRTKRGDIIKILDSKLTSSTAEINSDRTEYLQLEVYEFNVLEGESSE